MEKIRNASERQEKPVRSHHWRGRLMKAFLDIPMSQATAWMIMGIMRNLKTDEKREEWAKKTLEKIQALGIQSEDQLLDVLTE